MTANGPSRRDIVSLLGATALATTACSGASTGPAPTATGSTATGSTTSGSTATGSTTSVRGPVAGPDITHGPRDRNEVALTFHGAGDLAILRRMLAEFADAGAHVTVLAIGQWLADNPAAARLVLDGGHDLGNHTWSHRTMPRLPAGTVRSEIDRAAAQLRRLTGSPGRWFRPSGTAASTPAIRAAAVAAGYGACLGYDVDPLDYTDPGPDAVARAFSAAVRPGSVVSLHLGHAGTLAAMPRMLTALSERQLTAVTATDLLLRA